MAGMREWHAPREKDVIRKIRVPSGKHVIRKIRVPSETRDPQDPRPVEFKLPVAATLA
jgi:hypothetical protein